MVLFLYALKQLGKTPSINRAVKMAESRYSKKLAKQNRMKPIPHSETNIRKHWKDFKTVSHLWAAHFAFNEDELVMLTNDFDLFLAHSEFLLSFCLEMVLERVKTPLFNKDEMWQVPKTYPLQGIAPIEILGIDETLRKEIENYKV